MPDAILDLQQDAELILEGAELLEPLVKEATAAAEEAEDYAALAEAWAQSPTAPDPDDPTSKSVKTIANELKQTIQSTDFDTIDKTGFYRSAATDAHQPVVGESTVVLHMEGAGGRRYQIAQWGDNTAVRYRGPSGASYGSWKVLLKTGDAIPTAMTVASDANNATNTEIYWLPTGSLNTPVSTSQFILKNFRRTLDIHLQEATEIRGATITGAVTKTWTRHRTTTGGWQPWVESVTDGSDSIPHYRKWDNVKNLAVNETPLADGSLLRSMTYEARDCYTSRESIRVTPTDLAECSFYPVSETESARLYAQTPIMGATGAAQRRVMPVIISTTLFNTNIAEPIFKPLVTGPRGWLTFRYIGEEPLYTTLRGSISALVKISDVDEDAQQEFLLKLRCLNPPRYDELESGTGERGLAHSIGGNAKPYRLNANTLFADPCLPITEECLTTPEPNLYVGSDNGYLDNNNLQEAVLTTDTEGPVPPQVRTTKWIDVESYDKDVVSFFMYCPSAASDVNKFPYSERRRVQIKDADGVIHAVNNITWDDGDNGAFTVYRLPRNAAKFRVYYAGRGSDIDDTKIIFKALTPELSAKVDPTKGLWREMRFDVCREVVFYPNRDYFFAFDSIDPSGVANSDFAFRYSGGLSCMFDVSKKRSAVANALFKDSY